MIKPHQKMTADDADGHLMCIYHQKDGFVKRFIVEIMTIRTIALIINAIKEQIKPAIAIPPLLPCFIATTAKTVPTIDKGIKYGNQENIKETIPKTIEPTARPCPGCCTGG